MDKRALAIMDGLDEQFNRAQALGGEPFAVVMLAEDVKILSSVCQYKSDPRAQMSWHYMGIPIQEVPVGRAAVCKHVVIARPEDADRILTNGELVILEPGKAWVMCAKVVKKVGA